MNETLRPMPLTPDDSPQVDSTFTPSSDRPSAYHTSGWEAKDKRWKGWPGVIIGLVVVAGVIGANYETKRKAEEREAVAMAQAEAPAPTTQTEPTTPTSDTTAQAPATAAPTNPEDVLKQAPSAAGPAATPKREATRAPASERSGAATSQRAAQPHENAVAVAPRVKEPAAPAPVLKPAEPIVSVPTPAPTPPAPAAEAKPPAPDPQPTPAPAPQPEQQPPSQ